MKNAFSSISSLQYYSTKKSFIKILGDLNETSTIGGPKKVGGPRNYGGPRTLDETMFTRNKDSSISSSPYTEEL